jgi:hypothetical protein
MRISDTGDGCDRKQTGLPFSALLQSRYRIPLCVDGKIQYPYLCRIEASNSRFAGAVLAVREPEPGKVAP